MLTERCIRSLANVHRAKLTLPICNSTARRSLVFSPPGVPSSRTSRLRKYTLRTACLALGLGTAWTIDSRFNASAISRNFRTLWTCLMITLDYKLNFTPEKSHLIPELHERVAERMYNLFTSNGGLYIKIGQAIGANTAMLPLPMQRKFSKLFDDAPQISYSTVRSVFMTEFGRSPEDVFEVFEEEAVASASIAQVHRAKLRAEHVEGGDDWNRNNGRWVAVKVQKPDVGKQVEWDLGAFRIVMWMFEHWVFDLPSYFVVDFISNHLRAELDFLQESSNAMQTSQFIASEPRLSEKVYIPKVYPSLTTKKVLTAEWIDGVRLSDRPAIRRLMGETDQPHTNALVLGADSNHLYEHSGLPLNGGVKSIMKIMVSLFSAQMFSWGWVHCDPHPGNIIIRPSPYSPTEPQLVLLDHGLYVRLSEKFKRQYAELWRGLLGGDWIAIEEVTKDWGIGTPDLFASATLMRPIRIERKANGNGNGNDNGEISEYEKSVRLKRKLKCFLTDTDKMPKELIFIGRNMRMVQGNNQSLSSPVNRIKVMGLWASRSLTMSPTLTLYQRLREYYHYMVFRSVLFSLDFAFWVTRMRQWLISRFGLEGEREGFEDELERSMRGLAKSNLGFEIAPNAFEG